VYGDEQEHLPKIDETGPGKLVMAFKFKCMALTYRDAGKWI